jgi:hypothetical protein
VETAFNLVRSGLTANWQHKWWKAWIYLHNTQELKYHNQELIYNSYAAMAEQARAATPAETTVTLVEAEDGPLHQV